MIHASLRPVLSGCRSFFATQSPGRAVEVLCPAHRAPRWVPVDGFLPSLDALVLIVPRPERVGSLSTAIALMVLWPLRGVYFA